MINDFCQDQPHVFLMMLSLCFPLRDGPVGKCLLLPAGLPNPALTAPAED